MLSTAPANNPPCSSGDPPAYLEVWLQAGQAGRVFTYANALALPLAEGDLVQVRLQGRLHAGLVVACHDNPPKELVSTSLQPVLALLERAAVTTSWQQLIAAVARQCHTTVFRALRSALPPGWLGPRRNLAAKGRALVLKQRTSLPLIHAAELPPRQRQLLDHLERHGGERLLRDLIGTDGFSRGVVDALEKRGLLRSLQISPPSPEAPQQAPPRLLPQTRALTTPQEEAVQSLRVAPPGSQWLLWGVTGSGKTEVYLRVAAEHLAKGQSVLLLTPEIGLVPQLLDRARQRFGPGVLEYHSGLGERERIACWRSCLAAAQAPAPTPLVVVGTRSAIFLPLAPLGLIVLDEEHDSSWKQESPMPCYHARQVARLRCQLEGATLLLGSATPSLESWLSTQSPGATTRLLRLPERIGRRPLPAVQVVDMRQELAEGHRRLLSRPLLERLNQLRERGEQAVILVPRRGYRSFLSCRSCGTVVQCPHCDVALTVHRRPNGAEWLRCHWCDHRQELGQRCPSCGSSAFKPFGAGTQRVMEQLVAELEGLRVLRFDADTTRGKDGHRRVLDAFGAHQADVLVGTQMLAKGMDLPSVTLAAVLAADGLLHRPDLRAAEQSLQLLFQLAGRAGRGEQPGEVLVQTYTPDHPVIRHLVDGRYGRFLREEASQRRHGQLVPFSRACLLRLAGPTASATATSATALAEQIRPEVEARGWCLIGPAPAPVARVAGRSRWQLLLHGPAERGLPLPDEQVLRALLHRSVSLAIDPDPLEL
ncbi:MAG: primosomal protein N' [Cyanobacteriota bacterium]|nr:primosomal protein N' [Cyanobacteriota bacterium]